MNYINKRTLSSKDAKLIYLKNILCYYTITNLNFSYIIIAKMESLLIKKIEYKY